MAVTVFYPEVHGFLFVDFHGPDGVTGGLAWAALDHWHYRTIRATPSYDNGSFPGGYLADGPNIIGSPVTLLGYVTERDQACAASNDPALHAGPATAVAHAQLAKAMIDARLPVPLALPRGGGVHHVIGYNAQERAGKLELVVYDPTEEGVVLARVVGDGEVHRLRATANPNGGWTAGTEIEQHTGLWVATGYTPRQPPAELTDVVALDVTVPQRVDADTPFAITVTLKVLSPFRTRVNAIGVLIDGRPGPTTVVGDGWYLTNQGSVQHEIELELTEGAHIVEVVYYPEESFVASQLYKRLFISRAIEAGPSAASLGLGSYLEVGGIGPGPMIAAVLGAQLAGPGLFSPGVIPRYAVTAYRIAMKVWVEDYYNGGVFDEPLQSVECTLDGGALQGLTIHITGPREATIEATYGPLAGRVSTHLSIVATDASGRVLTKVIGAPTSDSTVILLGKRPDFRETMRPPPWGPRNDGPLFGYTFPQPAAIRRGARASKSIEATPTAKAKAKAKAKAPSPRKKRRGG
ncbi:MAG: hypothetical protein U0414_08720 [Polyangiaceae bacterium]